MKIGLIGAGHIGSNLARLAIKNGDDVIISNSRDPETLADLVAELGPHAKAAWAKGAATEGDLVVVTIPLKNYQTVPVEPLEGKVVIDTMNYYPARDGHIADLDSGKTTTSELLQAHLPDSKVVKAFNSIFAGDLISTALPKEDPNRRTLPIAGNNAAAKMAVATLIDQFGFDVYDAGPLREGFRFQNGTPAYTMRANREQLIEALKKG
ncbi:NADPH-dependent F420 reductase [Lentilactobacillus kisonensis]|uniref:NADP oxidoreductase coenzyme F420-dependent n=1 Tax=Lentilactobacillus kisonensis DSM 19906 = JCM 15041 TaxID=1423766 RepID=A0A0R1NS83_9LACO|nr:NAD(P)-binding domain-containing protein [Lentilactobacillus kisonensis]KRL22934.1 NADP oxidoreductase coenzyme F420-dependent [Lentilactobacillus kisonensis DSM 19906 = JCM 15041]